MKRKPAKLSGQVRAAIDASGLTRYRICQLTGIDQSTLSKFMAGKAGLSTPALDALAEVLALRIVADAPSSNPSSREPRRKGSNR